MSDLFKPVKRTALEAGQEAAKIIFGPIAFQSARILRDSGMLDFFQKQGIAGASIAEAARHCKMREYGARVLVEAGLSMGLFYKQEESYILTKTGVFLINDEMSRINMDFVHDFCYQGMFYLDDSLEKGKPEGLKVFGKWPTVYEALSQLPEKAKKAWFGFDHFYSDEAFPKVLPLVFDDNPPKKMLDIGGNTGKWSLQTVAYHPEVQMGIADLQGQINTMQDNIKGKPGAERITGHPINVLDPQSSFPEGYDAMWMSQFLVCFSLEEVDMILSKAANALESGGRLFILDTYWDRQENDNAAYVLIQTSLYFTAFANGNSQMYRSDDILKALEKAGFTLERQIDHIGHSHTLFVAQKK